MKIKLTVDVREIFLPLFRNDAPRFTVVISHRRSGKTVAALQKLVASAASSSLPNSRYLYVAPFRAQAKDVAWDYLKGFIREIPKCAISESELKVSLPTGASIRLAGADNFDALRGGYVDGVVLDEVAQMPPPTWTQVVRPMLADRHGWALFIGTPAGKNYFFELWEQSERAKDWARYMFKASETDLLAPAELEAARQAMTPEAYAQEFECSFSAAVRGAFYGEVMEQLEAQGRMIPLDYDPSQRLITAWDLGVRDATAIWIIQPYRGNSWAVLDYYESSGAGVEHYAAWLGAHGYMPGNAIHLAPHDIANTDWSAAGSLNRRAVAERHGIRFERIPRPLNSVALMDEINATRAILGNCYFHHGEDDRGSRVYMGRVSLSLYRQKFDERRGALQAVPEHDRHCLVGETELLTPYGKRPILELPKSGMVLTSCGWKRYWNPRITQKNVPVVAVQFSDGYTVTCTAAHRFKTANGWMCAGDLRPTTPILCGSIPLPSTLTGAFTDCIRIAGRTLAVAKDVCIELCGRAYSELYRKAITSTISTIATPTTELTTLFAPPATNTLANIGTLNALKAKKELSAPPRAVQPLLGTRPRKAGSGTAGTREKPRPGKNGLAKSVLARIAGSCLWPSSVNKGTRSVIAACNVKERQIVRVVALNERRDVWCLTVPDAHEFALANGALVHNSHAADAFRTFAGMPGSLVRPLDADTDEPSPNISHLRNLRPQRSNTLGSRGYA